MTALASIESVILTLRNQKVILDSDLAALYGVTTKSLNQAVKRNRNRFPSDFLFAVTMKEKTEVVTNCDHLKHLKFSSYRPYAFTEHGAFMAANVLKSKRAVAMSVYVIRAFVKIREAINVNHVLEKRFSVIEKRLLEHDQALRQLFVHIKPLLLPPAEKPKRQIGFR